MPLVLGDAGCEYDIKKIGGNDEVRTRLSAMGFVPGAKVTLVSCNNGSVIVRDQRHSCQKDHGLNKGCRTSR